MAMAARLLNAQRWKNTEIGTTKEWTMKMIELVEMAKLTSGREKTTTFVKE